MNILITGGASGLGEAITEKMALSAKGTVYFTYNSSVTKAKAIEDRFKNCKGIQCDFTNGKDVSDLTGKMESMDLDVLINNAYSGTFINSHFHKTGSEDFLREFKNNILPTISVTQTAISSFRKKKNGKIITVLTAALLNNPPVGSSVYVANKAYLEELTKVWATENVKFNITSNSISPTFMQTDFTKGMDERLIAQMLDQHPLKKFLGTEEVADCVAFLAQASPHLNGVNIVLNSAMNMK